MQYNNAQNKHVRDWHSELNLLAYAFGEPLVSGRLKVSPDDFCVIENLGFSPSGAGEHHWLRIVKTKCNTEELARALAKFAKVAYRDVGYSGMKDYYAVTTQWFSVWVPGVEEPNWQDFDMLGTKILEVTKHARKIRRGTHQSNFFKVQLNNLTALKTDVDTRAELLRRIELIKANGVPNYFGPQRFGHKAKNMDQSVALLTGTYSPKNRNLRGLLLSAARSWIFNTVVSARVTEQSWMTLLEHEPACLDGSNSVFISTDAVADAQRIKEFDIHPSAPMWGRGADHVMRNSALIYAWEQSVLNDESVLCDALQRVGLEYQRRTIRIKLQSIDAQFNHQGMLLRFELQRGQYATSVIRELIKDQDIIHPTMPSVSHIEKPTP